MTKNVSKALRFVLMKTGGFCPEEKEFKLEKETIDTKEEYDLRSQESVRSNILGYARS